MKTTFHWSLVLSSALLLGACGNNSNQGDGFDGDTDTDTFESIPLSSLAMLLVVDNGLSTGEDIQILAGALGDLAASLTSTHGVDDIRVAAVTADMGLSWGGNPYQEGDGWPGTNPCSAVGDNGVFQGCHDPVFTYAETAPDSPNPDLQDHMGCLADQGTQGCGLEQTLQSAAHALERPDQQDFLRAEDLLLILVITNDTDCSIEDGPALFGSDEIQSLGELYSRANLACELNEETLYSTGHYAASFWAARQNAYNAVIFAAIVGVPMESECQGSGDEIAGCLDHPGMQLTEYLQMNSAGQDVYFWEHVCTRSEGLVQLDAALPGRRYVDLAVNYFGGQSYVYSICNSDWTPAMNDLAQMVEDSLQ